MVGGFVMSGRLPSECHLLPGPTAVHYSHVVKPRRLVTVTLGTASEAQLIDTLDGKADRTFLLHYNFPGF